MTVLQADRQLRWQGSASSGNGTHAMFPSTSTQRTQIHAQLRTRLESSFMGEATLAEAELLRHPRGLQRIYSMLARSNIAMVLCTTLCNIHEYIQMAIIHEQFTFSNGCRLASSLALDLAPVGVTAMHLGAHCSAEWLQR